MLKEKKIFKKNIFVISIYFCSILHPKNKSELWSIEFAKLFRLRRSLFQFEKRFFEMKVTMVSSVMILKFLVVLNLSRRPKNVQNWNFCRPFAKVFAKI